MKMAKKLICLTLVALLVLSLVACGKSTQQSSKESGKESEVENKTENEQKEDSKDSGKQETGSQAGKEKWEPQSDLSKHVTITLAAVQAQDGYDYTNGDGVAQYYSKKFNYTLEVTALTWSNWNERCRIWINSGDMPDVLVFNFTQTNYPEAAGYVEQGLLYKLPDDWKSRWPNVARVFEVTGLGPQMEKQFGGTYFLPRARFYKNMINEPGEPVPDHWSLYMRKDWAKAVNFPIKSTYKVSEILDFARLIKEKDPGNVGNKLIPISADPHAAVLMFIQSNSTHYNTFYKDPKDGQYKWGGASEDTLRGLKLMAQAYKEGLLDPDFITLKPEDSQAPFDTQGVAACNFNQAPTAAIHPNFINRFQANLGLDPFEHINMATVLGEDGYYHQRDLINFWGTIVFSPNIKKEVFERYMDILDYNATEEGRTTLFLGLKDVDWTYDQNGKIISLYDEKKEGRPLGGSNGKYPSLGYTLGAIVLFDDFAFNNPNHDPRCLEISRQLYKDRCEISTPETFTKTNWDLYTFDSPNMKRAQFDYDTELCNLVTMPGDIEENWKKWVDSKMPIIQPVLDELNAKLGSKK
ncbi:putative aldouronate transport system substrate-binding protein [Caldicoprobacter guelmensis]|uniref:ABC transporter substrate-binding protein n=1 Tax=Caldicoprobacter guelmensis TaxID=1170224 RepID=UPI00195B8AB0|nr:ABC transporter substrate-binding protein [Caldicoprobacter guelmensis]MBM7583453.1 putative aldouronate transport system substrate-binding protein [Caldicoprobacter guelmensis]